MVSSGHQSVTPFLSGAPPPKKNPGSTPAGCTLVLTRRPNVLDCISLAMYYFTISKVDATKKSKRANAMHILSITVNLNVVLLSKSRYVLSLFLYILVYRGINV